MVELGNHVLVNMASSGLFVAVAGSSPPRTASWRTAIGMPPPSATSHRSSPREVIIMLPLYYFTTYIMLGVKRVSEEAKPEANPLGCGIYFAPEGSA